MRRGITFTAEHSPWSVWDTHSLQGFHVNTDGLEEGAFTPNSSPMTMPFLEAVKDSAPIRAQSECEVLTQCPPPEAIPRRSRKLKVLLVEDNASDSELMLHALGKGGFDSQSEVVQTAEDFAERIRTNKYEIVLADYRLPGWNGMETVTMLRQEGLDIPVVLVSGALGELKAVE